MLGWGLFSVRRVGAVVATTALVAASVRALGACILADPPAELPPTTPHRPVIYQDAVVPPLPLILGSSASPFGLPQFIIPVEVFPGTTTFTWEFWVDPGQQCFTSPRLPETPAGDGGPGLVQFSPLCSSPPDPSSCHAVHFLVALSFPDSSERTVPDQYGADSITWLYDPSGTGSCPSYDAGSYADGAFGDAGPSDGMAMLPVDGSVE